jgi:hypothetical protein
MVIKSIIGATCACLAVVSFNTSAALIERLGGLAYYDDVADLTWLADAKAAAGSVFDDGPSTIDGAMTWVNAKAWAANLEVDSATGWRLADTLQPDSSCDTQTTEASLGFNCSGSELGNLFYNVLGGVAGSKLSTIHNANYDLFNIGITLYWSATELGPDNAFSFSTYNGDQGVPNKISNGASAWAVQSGDVSAVPVPAAAWLFGSGFIGLIGVARRKARS